MLGGVQRRLQQLLQMLFEGAPVGQPGQLVVARLIRQLCRQLARLGDVAQHQYRALRYAMAVADRRGGLLHREFLAVEPQQAGAAVAADAASLAQYLLDRVRLGFVGVIVDQLEHEAGRLAQRLLLAPAGKAQCRRVEIADAAFGIGGDHRIADRFQRDLRTFLFGADCRFDPHQLRNVARNAAIAAEPALDIEDRFGTDFQPFALSGIGVDAVAEAVERAMCRHFLLQLRRVALKAGQLPVAQPRQQPYVEHAAGNDAGRSVAQPQFDVGFPVVVRRQQHEIQQLLARLVQLAAGIGQRAQVGQLLDFAAQATVRRQLRKGTQPHRNRPSVAVAHLGFAAAGQTALDTCQAGRIFVAGADRQLVQRLAQQFVAGEAEQALRGRVTAADDAIQVERQQRLVDIFHLLAPIVVGLCLPVQVFALLRQMAPIALALADQAVGAECTGKTGAAARQQQHVLLLALPIPARCAEIVIFDLPAPPQYFGDFAALGNPLAAALQLGRPVQQLRPHDRALCLLQAEIADAQRWRPVAQMRLDALHQQRQRNAQQQHAGGRFVVCLLQLPSARIGFSEMQPHLPAAGGGRKQQVLAALALQRFHLALQFGGGIG